MTSTETRSTTQQRPIDRVLARVAEQRDALAALRRGVGRPLGESPDAWPYVLEVAGDKRYREEPAHVALGLFALHQQSQSPGAMNRSGCGLGQACRRLRGARGAEGSSEEGVERRFKAALGAETPETLAVHLRGLVTMLRGAGIPLDYPRLYQDLCSWRYPERRQRVCLAWARDYFTTKSDEEDEEGEKNQ